CHSLNNATFLNLKRRGGNSQFVLLGLLTQRMMMGFHKPKIVIAQPIGDGQ
ncbi:unnamed protein product, partial [Arabidopsis halleri]